MEESCYYDIKHGVQPHVDSLVQSCGRAFGPHEAVGFIPSLCRNVGLPGWLGSLQFRSVYEDIRTLPDEGIPISSPPLLPSATRKSLAGRDPVPPPSGQIPIYLLESGPGHLQKAVHRLPIAPGELHPRPVNSNLR